MKSMLAISLFGAALLWSGCSGGAPGRVDTTAQYPELGAREPITPPASEGDASEGHLVVYTPTILNESAGDTDTGALQVRSGYTIYDRQGEKVKDVENNRAPGEPGPFEVALPPGKYLVRLDQMAGGTQFFWVTIEKGKLTRVEEKSWEKA